MKTDTATATETTTHWLRPNLNALWCKVGEREDKPSHLYVRAHAADKQMVTCRDCLEAQEEYNEESNRIGQLSNPVYSGGRWCEGTA